MYQTRSNSHHRKIRGAGIAKIEVTLMLAALLALGATPAGQALAQSSDQNGLKLPEDIVARSAEVPKFTIEERRIGSRLERVTVHHQSGLDEIYENRNVDSMWVTEEKQLGETPNVRRWTIGSW